MGTDSGAGKRAHVLVLDDDELILRACTRVFEDEHEVTTMQRARDAIDEISAGSEYDLILCDLQMPDMNGIKFHAAVWRLVPSMVDRMVFMTGAAIDDRTAAFLQSVPNETLEKPVGVERLQKLARKYAALRDSPVDS